MKDGRKQRFLEKQKRAHSAPPEQPAFTTLKPACECGKCGECAAATARFRERLLGSSRGARADLRKGKEES